jgi:hypothetical protein
VLFAENSVGTFSVHPLHLHEVISAPRTLDVEGDFALWILALNASTLCFQTANYALEAKAFMVDFVQAYGGLGCHDRAWDPICT